MSARLDQHGPATREAERRRRLWRARPRAQCDARLAHRRALDARGFISAADDIAADPAQFEALEALAAKAAAIWAAIGDQANQGDFDAINDGLKRAKILAEAVALMIGDLA